MRIINNDVTMLYQAKKLLIVVDMLNGFINDGALADQGIKRIIPRELTIIKEALESDDTAVIFVCDAHSHDSIEFQRYPVHCIKDTKESMIIDELKPFQKDVVVYLKNSTNIIYALEKDLHNMKFLEDVRLIGCLTDICIYDGAYALRTFFDEYNRNIHVGVYKDAVATYDSFDHPSLEVSNETFKLMNMKGIEIYENIS